MGMYTRFAFEARLRRDAPDFVLEVLDAITSDQWDRKIQNIALPGAPFFSCDRWQSLFWGGNGDHFERPQFVDHRLTIKSEFKNYHGEIGHFIAWITPYLDEPEGMELGYKHYEEDEKPTKIVMPKTAVGSHFVRPKPEPPERVPGWGTW